MSLKHFKQFINWRLASQQYLLHCTVNGQYNTRNVSFHQCSRMIATKYLSGAFTLIRTTIRMFSYYIYLPNYLNVLMHAHTFVCVKTSQW